MGDNVIGGRIRRTDSLMDPDSTLKENRINFESASRSWSGSVDATMRGRALRLWFTIDLAMPQQKYWTGLLTFGHSESLTGPNWPNAVPRPFLLCPRIERDHVVPQEVCFNSTCGLGKIGKGAFADWVTSSDADPTAFRISANRWGRSRRSRWL
jgi:hypothetical protein